MKKFIINLVLVMVFLIIYFLQANLFTWFKIAGVMPNIFVIQVLFIGLYGHKFMGLTYGVILGLLIDCFIGKKIGINAIMLGIVGIIGMTFDRNFSKENRITLIIMVMIATMAFEIGGYIINYLVNKSTIDILPFIQILLIECIYNGLITIILYPLMKIFGNKIETEYKGNKILTRYF